MSSEAHLLMERSWARAKDLMRDEPGKLANESAAEERTSRNLGLAGEQMKGLFYADKGDPRAAVTKAMSPTFSLACEETPERLLKDLFSRLPISDVRGMFSQSEACDELMENMPEIYEYRIAGWGFGDGSALMAMPGWSLSEFGMQLKTSEFADEGWAKRLTDENFRLADIRGGQEFSDLMRKFWVNALNSVFFVPMTGDELDCFCKGFKAWKSVGTGGWKTGFVMRQSGNLIQPDDFEKCITALTGGPKDTLMKDALARMAKIRKERDTKLQMSWQDMICGSMGKAPGKFGDVNLSGFFMVDSSAFSRKERKIWEQLHVDLVKYMTSIPDGKEPEVRALEGICSVLTNPQTAANLPHFVYRAYRTGGALSYANKALLYQRERIEEDLLFEEKLARAKEKGITALLPKRKALLTGDIPVSFARSVEFCAQYGCALALGCAMWAKDDNFKDVSQQAKAFVGSMIGAEEVAIKCYGYFAKLLETFSGGSIPKEDIERKLVQRMEEASKESQRTVQSGAPKSELKNEWTGKWSQVIASQRIREFLGLPVNAQAAREAAEAKKKLEGG